MFDFEEFGKRSIYRRHLDTGLVSSLFRDTCPVLSSRGWCVDGYFLSGERDRIRLTVGGHGSRTGVHT
jgi:hypothetical protein